jgi:hypothetical protein
LRVLKLEGFNLKVKLKLKCLKGIPEGGVPEGGVPEFGVVCKWKGSLPRKWSWCCKGGFVKDS